MALTTSGINELQECCNKLHDCGVNLVSTVLFTNINDDFQTFIEGTEVGGEYAAKWNQLNDIIFNDLAFAIVHLQKATQKYIDNQKEINHNTGNQ